MPCPGSSSSNSKHMFGAFEYLHFSSQPFCGCLFIFLMSRRGVATHFCGAYVLTGATGMPSCRNCFAARSIAHTECTHALHAPNGDDAQSGRSRRRRRGKRTCECLNWSPFIVRFSDANVMSAAALLIVAHSLSHRTRRAHALSR